MDHNEEEIPNFLDPKFAEDRLIFTVEGKTDEEAAQSLLSLWRLRDTREKDAQTQRREQEERAARIAREQAEQEEERLRLAREEELIQTRRDEQKKYKNKFAPIPDKPLPSTPLLIFPQHAVNSIRKGEYLPLYFLTNAGIRDADGETPSSNDDILTLVQTDTGPVFQSAAASKAKHCKTPDEFLTWEEFSEANYRMLSLMQQQDWPEERITMLRDFWLAIENHEFRHGTDEYGKKALLVYQAKVRRQWHQTMGTPASFKLTPLNEDRIQAFQKELQVKAVNSEIDRLRQVCSFFLLYETNTPTNQSLSPPPLFPTPLFPPTLLPPTPIPDPYAGDDPYGHSWDAGTRTSIWPKRQTRTYSGVSSSRPAPLPPPIRPISKPSPF